MARREQDREDLLHEAKALVERIALQLTGDEEETLIGFRRDRSASVFFGAARVYHFTPAGRLRRAFIDDLLYKADRGNLVVMRRQRRVDAVELVSRPLDAALLRDFLDQMQSRLNRLRNHLDARSFTLVGQVPQGTDVAQRVRAWLAALPMEVPVARSPRAD